MDLAYSIYSVYVRWLYLANINALHLYIKADLPPFTNEETEVVGRLNNASKFPQLELNPCGWQVRFIYYPTRLSLEWNDEQHAWNSYFS